MAILSDREYDAELHKLNDQLLLMGAKVYFGRRQVDAV